MKVLSLTQPWASLMAFNEKRVETRSWATPHRGALAIAASKGFPRDAKELCNRDPFAKVLRKHGVMSHYQLPLGVILCVVDVVGCVPTGKDVDAEPSDEAKELMTENPPAFFDFEFGDYSPNRWLWITRNYRRITPIPATGRLGLWDHDVPT